MKEINAGSIQFAMMNQACGLFEMQFSCHNGPNQLLYPQRPQTRELLDP